MFGTAPNYNELNAVINRNTPIALHAPVLVWYLAFWTNTTDGPGHIKRGVDDFIQTLGRTLRETGHAVEVEPCISNLCILFGRVCREKTFASVRDDIVLTPRQDDIFKSSGREVLLKFEWRGLKVSIQFAIHTEYFSIATFIELEKGRNKQPYSNSTSLNLKIDEILCYLKEGGEAKSLNKYFFSDFWEEYDAAVLSDRTIKSIKNGSLFQNVFADIRGMVLSEQAIPFPNFETISRDEKPVHWGLKAKDRLLPLLRTRNEGRYEHTVNYLLDGRAIYLSALGPQSPSVPATQRIPIEFIIYAHQKLLTKETRTIVNSRQLGRLVIQMLLLATNRLAALKDVRLLHKVGRLLGLLDKSTQNARQAIAKSDDQAIYLIRKAHKNFNSITGRFLNNTGSGLFYRIERSRYYVTQFLAGVKLLRIERIEGDQPYDEFIARQLGSEFNFIDRLGLRYVRATDNVVTLDQNYLAMKANKIDEDIQNIQQWGEVALFGALVPYYIMHLLDLIIVETYIPEATIGFWTWFGCLAIYRKFGTKKAYKRQLVYPTILTLVVVGALHLAQNSGLADGVLRSPGEQLIAQKELLKVQQESKAEQKESQALRVHQLKILENLLDSQKKLLSVWMDDAWKAERLSPKP